MGAEELRLSFLYRAQYNTLLFHAEHHLVSPIHEDTNAARHLCVLHLSPGCVSLIKFSGSCNVHRFSCQLVHIATEYGDRAGFLYLLKCFTHQAHRSGLSYGVSSQAMNNTSCRCYRFAVSNHEILIPKFGPEPRAQLFIAPYGIRSGNTILHFKCDLGERSRVSLMVPLYFTSGFSTRWSSVYHCFVRTN